MAIAGHDLKTPVCSTAYAIRKVQRTLTPEQGAPLNVATEALARIDRSSHSWPPWPVPKARWLRSIRPK
jgi:hypothetical protein